MRNKLTIFLMGLLICCCQVTAQKKLVVSQNGKGDFKSIQAAINSLPDSSAAPATIFIKKGVYREKLYIEKHNIILQGEDLSNTIITQSIARDAWRCRHIEDWGVATVNVDGNDITFKNLTIINNYGFETKKEVIIDCPSDTVTRRKAISASGHQMALRTMSATRFKAINCHFKAFGGDTVSPWNVEGGLFYFKDCIMEGGVDFYCPRGWAYAENCEFIAHTGVAAIWHDGSKHEDSKTVLKNCRFKGFDNFKLGRYHRDAQFYLINCSFAANMANEAIYRVPTTNTILWGHRVYYYNCHRQGGDYAWHADNLSAAPGSPNAEDITTAWVFKGRWNPAAP
ncbi:MAG: pectinesterase family protein [Chitinophagaceae bacterium]